MAPTRVSSRILTALAPFERYAQRRGHRFTPLTLSERQLIRLMHRWQPEHEVAIQAERAYAAVEISRGSAPNSDHCGVLHLNAQICLPAPLRLSQQTGRPHLVRVCLLNLAVYAEDAATGWTPCTVARWHGEHK